MEELKQLIICFFNESNGKYTYDVLKKKMNIKGENQTEIFDVVLNGLIEDGCLFFNSKKEYSLFDNVLNVVYGAIEINKNGTGFIHTNNDETIIIENHNLNGALDGDIVLVNSIYCNNKGDYNGSVNKIIKRKNGLVIFKVIGDGKDSILLPYNDKNNIKVLINKNELLKLSNNQLIVVKVGTEKIDNLYKAEIINTIGNLDDLDIDIRIIASEYNVPIDFSQEALDEALKLPTTVTNEEIKTRVDLRNKNIFTIDCDDTKDRDDAVGIEVLENGNFKLYVCISDVSYYVKKDSAIFNDAMQRNTSHYLNNTCIPMFPKQLSNGICSLNENVDRLTKTCEMEIDKNGKVINYSIYKSVINSKKAMKYSEINNLLNGNNVDEYENFRNDIILMNELSEILEKIKKERKYLDFDIPDIKIVQSIDGKVIDFKANKQGKAEKIIENFMVITNTIIAENYSWLPFIYRVHEIPNEKSIKDVIQILKDSGIEINNIKSINQYNLNNILDELSKKDTHDIFKKHLLKSMKRARYDINNLGHFALQLNDYCHFTSPIRRIADFTIHTLIDEIDNFDFEDMSKLKELEKELDIICKNASTAEKIDFEMEKEATAMAMAEYMENHIGVEYEGHITEIYENGVFIKTSNNILGKLKLSNIYDDKYYYDYNKNAIIGKRNKNKYKIGDKVYIVVKDACKANRTINFEMNNQKKLIKNKNSA